MAGNIDMWRILHLVETWVQVIHERYKTIQSTQTFDLEGKRCACTLIEFCLGRSIQSTCHFHYIPNTTLIHKTAASLQIKIQPRMENWQYEILKQIQVGYSLCGNDKCSSGLRFGASNDNELGQINPHSTRNMK